jgi:hypothetical protein
VHRERRICIEERPTLVDTPDGHRAACHFPGELRQAGLDPATVAEAGAGAARRAAEPNPVAR